MVYGKTSGNIHWGKPVGKTWIKLQQSVNEWCLGKNNI